MNSATGRRYRKLVLEPGAGVSEAGSLKEFLRRNPSSEAYFAEVIEVVERGLIRLGNLWLLDRLRMVYLR